MKTVQDYRDLGLVFVKGDFTIESDGSSNRGDNGFDVNRHFNQNSAFNTSKVESFAWRNNDGAKPEYKGDKEIELKCGKVKLVSRLNLGYNEDWSLAGLSSDIVKWRPVVLQSDLPTVSPKEDKPMKPVYTAEMHAKGELPPIGAECLVKVDNSLRFNKYTVMYISNSGSMVLRRVESEIDLVVNTDSCEFKPIIKTIKVNGFDVPAPMSENIKVGDKYFFPAPAIERYFQHTYWDGGDFDKLNLARGTIHSTESAAIAHAKAMLGIDPNA